jgi:membrane protein
MVKSGSNGASWSWLIARESFLSFGAHRSLQSAAMLAFYGFLSLMPLLLVVIFLFGRVLQSSEAAFAAVRGVLSDLLPTFSEQMLGDLLRLANQKAWGVVSLVVLMWSITPFAGAVREAIGRAFQVEREPGYLRAKLRDLAAVLGLLVLFLALVAVKAFLPMVSGAAAFRWLAAAGSGLVSLAVLLWFFAVFSPARRSPGLLLAGALTAAVLLAVMRPLFGLVLQFNPNYGYAFGSLKTIFLLLVWVYYTFAVLLFAAEVMANLRRRDALVLRGLLRPGGHAATTSRLLERFTKSLPPAGVLFREGDAGPAMYFISAGAIHLSTGGRLVRELGPGGYFGEMSMLLDATRTATATAGPEGAVLVEIERENFDLLLRENPEIVQGLLRELADRLRRTNQLAAATPA